MSSNLLFNYCKGCNTLVFGCKICGYEENYYWYFFNSSSLKPASLAEWFANATADLGFDSRIGRNIAGMFSVFEHGFWKCALYGTHRTYNIIHCTVALLPTLSGIKGYAFRYNLKLVVSRFILKFLVNISSSSVNYFVDNND